MSPAADGAAPISVLFLCRANDARSQIAEALLQHKGAQRFIVASAGLEPSATVSLEAIEALAEVGVDWRGCPKPVATGESGWDCVIALWDRGNEEKPVLVSQPLFACWTVPDPQRVESAGRAKAFADTIALVGRRIDLMLMLPHTSLRSFVDRHRQRAAQPNDALEPA